MIFEMRTEMRVGFPLSVFCCWSIFLKFGAFGLMGYAYRRITTFGQKAPNFSKIDEQQKTLNRRPTRISVRISIIIYREEKCLARMLLRQSEKSFSLAWNLTQSIP
jgi:hypothetical protein